jgi:hypothetical protein
MDTDPTGEVVTDQGDGYVTKWACPAPDFGISFVVLRDEWSDDYTVRTIHEVRLP